MPDKKPTDNEIVKALECCKNDGIICWKCPYKKANGCMEKLSADALDLINRIQAENERHKNNCENCGAKTRVCIESLQNNIAKKQAEIERLKKEKDEYAYLYEKHINTAFSHIKAEAYKECIEKVKEEIAEALKSNYKARSEREQKIPIYAENEFLSYCSGKIDCLRGLDDFLDNLLKEIIGE